MGNKIMASQVDKNAEDIREIKQDIKTMKDNHLFHLERDVSKMEKNVEKIDNRLWWVLGLMVVSIVVGYIGDKI